MLFCGKLGTGISQCPGSFPDHRFLGLFLFTVSPQQSSLWMLEASEPLSLLLVTALPPFHYPTSQTGQYLESIRWV